MIDSNFSDIQPENTYNGDPSLPKFRYSAEERDVLKKRLLKQGLTDSEAETEISIKESEITNKMARVKIEKERLAA